MATLTEHYGEGAFELMPRSWLLPDHYWHWRLWAEAQVRLAQQRQLVSSLPVCRGRPVFTDTPCVLS